MPSAILYILRTGCQWRYLPREYPNYNSVYYHYHYHKWSWDGTWETVNAALRERVRREAGRKAQPSLAIIDSQSVGTTEVGGEHGFDGAKKVNGRKRHILVDTMGNLLKVIAHAANIGERAGAERLLNELPEPLWERLEKILASWPMAAMKALISRIGSSRPSRSNSRLPGVPRNVRALPWSRFVGSSKEPLPIWVAIAVSAKITNS